ncbi:ATP-binding cassette domain-containing protein [Auraticoccus sp. F435]|uniref:Fatty acid ABC transporter ATP-binding/permease protein n=1 Tax=Auraticoccus cholistanensis TaxID=2656650 RepID=A0A6A9UUB7_9ACTN|nr:ATP-binding cassette domain-containing protein [Auraticoccus cholistanensis]
MSTPERRLPGDQPAPSGPTAGTAAAAGTGATTVAEPVAEPGANQTAEPGGEQTARAPQRPAHGGDGGPFGGPRPQEQAMTFGPSLKRLVGLLRPEQVLVVSTVLLALVGVALNVVGPKILGLATDVIFTGVVGRQLPPGATKEQVVEQLRASGQDTFADLVSGLDVVPGQGIQFGELGTVLLWALAFYLVSSLLLLLQGYLLNGAVQRTVYRLRRDVEEKINRLPLRYFDNQPRGELLSRVTNDIDNVSQSLQQTLSQLLTALLTVIGVTVMMFVVSPLLAVIALITIPVSMAVTMVIGKRSQTRFVQNWKSTGELNAHIEEAFTGHALVKVYGRHAEVEQVFDDRNDELFRAGFGAQWISGLIMPVMMFIGNLNYVVIAVVGGLRVASGSMNLGDVQAFIQYSRMFTQPLTQVASMANLLQSGVASAERVFEVLDAEEQSAEAGGQLAPTRGRVEFEQVRFSYSPGTELITGLDLVAEPGQTVAIVGPTGAGKTTLVNLIMRFYELDGGRITLDGVDVSTVPRSALRAGVGMVLQDTWLFHGTIRENIAYGRPDATEAEILAAAEATYVDRFVHSLPDGYDTVIDEEGSNVSVGEKQLITIARAFLADPALLILDEATSSVDTRTEVLVQQAMNALRSDRTSFVIAHRLSTIRDADLILVMESGAIVEQGTHEELLAARGAYWDLYNAQFAAPIETEDAESAPSLP